MRTIAVINQKGGCGKTTTTINLAACLAEKRKKVLIVDIDPQAHATLGLGYNPGNYPRSVYDLFMEKDRGAVSVDDVLIKVSTNLHLLPSDLIMSIIEPVLLQRDNREYYLRDILGPISDRYDFIIIDCPPNIGVLTFNALFACTEVVIPIESGWFAMHGLAKLLETINMVNVNRKKKIIANALATMYDRRVRISMETLFELRQYLFGHVFNTLINQNIKLKEAAGHGQSIVSYCKTCTGYEDYMNLAKEVIKMDKVHLDLNEKGPGLLEPVVTKDGVMFSLYAPDARSVSVVADFNGWRPGSTPMFNMDGNGVWKKVVPLEQGKYEYKFLVDGKWVKDPHNSKKVVAEFGENSYIEVD